MTLIYHLGLQILTAAQFIGWLVGWIRSETLNTNSLVCEYIHQ